MSELLHRIVKTNVKIKELRIKAIRECTWREGEESLEEIIKIAELDGERRAYQTMNNLMSGREAEDDGEEVRGGDRDDNGADAEATS